MMVLVMVVIPFVCDQREGCLHQVKVENPSHHNHHLVEVVLHFFLVIVAATMVSVHV